MDQTFAKRHAYDSRLWAGIWLYALAVVLIGFSQPVTGRFFDEVREPATWTLVIHVWSFSAWLGLLAIQAWCAATKRMNWHRTFGLAMLPLAVIMVWSGMTAEFDGFLRDFPSGGTTRFLATSSTFCAAFTVFAVLAWVKRTDPPAHKRLILLATAAILGGAHARIIALFVPDVWGVSDFILALPLWFGGTWIIVGTGMAYDLLSRGTLHPVYKYAALPLLCANALGAYLYTSPDFNGWLGPILTG
jgi:hypothetical protein